MPFKGSDDAAVQHSFYIKRLQKGRPRKQTKVYLDI